jgi:hypothetical protein
MSNSRSLFLVSFFKSGCNLGGSALEVIKSSNSWAEFNAKLGELGTDGDHSNDKGNAFEVLTKLYLLTNPLTKNRAPLEPLGNPARSNG